MYRLNQQREQRTRDDRASARRRSAHKRSCGRYPRDTPAPRACAAGCGGIRPCTTESPATIGKPISSSDLPVRFATLNAIGISSTKPTSKNTGKPTMIATTHHRPVDMLFAEPVDQRIRDALCAAGLGHHLAEHRAEADHDRNVPERVAVAGLEGLDDLVHRHADGEAKQQRNDDQDEERVNLVARDQQDQQPQLQSPRTPAACCRGLAPLSASQVCDVFLCRVPDRAWGAARVSRD